MKFGIWELVIILVIVIVIFGPTQIPKLSKMIGKSARNFKEGMEEDPKDEAKENQVPDEKKD